VNTNLPFNFLHEAFENAIKEARDHALSGGAAPVNNSVNQVFAGARQKLIGGLKVFDESASATFTAVKITKDGLIVRGEIGSGPRQAPVVQFNEIDEGRAFRRWRHGFPGERSIVTSGRGPDIPERDRQSSFPGRTNIPPRPTASSFQGRPEWTRSAASVSASRERKPERMA